MKDRFLAGLTADLNIEPSSVQEPFDAGDEEGFRRAVEAFDLLLEFRTTNWGMGTATLVGKNRYGIGYLGQARLTSVRERKVLWQSGCIASPREEKPATLDELTRDDGALLKERLAGAAEVCTEGLLSQFWGKSGRR